jgi:RNA polymerase sigma-70 factor (ECF subfamily)
VREFEEAFDGLYGVAYRVAYRLTGERAEAEDVAQEALARAYSRWRRVDDYAEAWVSKVSANLAVDMWRRTNRPAVGTPPASRDIGHDAADRIDLHEALRTLPRRQQEVLVLRYLADLPEQDVARALGCSAGTVKQHASRGLHALRGVVVERHAHV